MKEKNNKNKENFLKILSMATPKEINDIIERRGNEPKPIPLVIFLD